MMLLSSKLVVFSLTLHLFHDVVLSSPMNHGASVLTQQGYVKGILQDIQTNVGQNKTIYKFLGVPYVKKPIGDLRFKPPQALSNRSSTEYNATFLRPICVQDGYYFDSIRGAWPEFDPKRDMSEDCLYLNIYTPSTRGTRKYPVIFYIHGGSYVVGTPSRDISPGEYLPTRDVVLVTIQYRLGTFGFFTTGDSEAPGNVGLLDQVAALRWVQQNIEGFGGDKNSVTLLGESAGGSSVCLHYLSPLSRGLFHRGIAVSGVDLSPFAYKPKSTVLKESNALVEKVNCRKLTSGETVRCLRSLSSSIVFENSDFWPMQPFVDQHFLPKEPKILRKEGKFQKLPFISGFTSQDGSPWVEYAQNFQNITYNAKGLSKYLHAFLSDGYQRKKDEARVAHNALEFQYTPWDDLNDPSRFREKLIAMWSDYYFIAPTDAALTFHSDHDAPTYMFEFAHRSQYHPKPDWMGVVHEDTTAYKFGLPLLSFSRSKLKFDEDDRNVSDLISTFYLNFAKFGQPTPTPVYGTQWDMFNSSNRVYLKIQKNPLMTSKYHPMRMAFWNSYFPTLLPMKKTLPPTIKESKSGVAMHGPDLVFVFCIGTLVRILGWKG